MLNFARSVLRCPTLALLGTLVFLPSCDKAADTTAVSAALTPGSNFDDCRGADWCPDMVVVPAGKFVMGSPVAEPGRFDDESPQHAVSVPTFAIGKYDVTRGQWSTFVKETKRPEEPGCAYAPPGATWSKPGFEQKDDHPVVCITWPDAKAYAAWLSKKTGKLYRLPSEAEWEYAARAGTKTAYPWGPKAFHDFANYGSDECCGPLMSGRDRWNFTSPVGSFKANAFGLFDMHGNVFQWVEDCHTDSYENAPRDGSAFSPKACAQRVARGGVYGDRPEVMRSAARNFAPPPDDSMTIAHYRSSGFGLRVARALP
jgi:formylglycine-generating enzyme required for sulfatase activity